MGLRRLLNCDEVPMNIEQFCPNWFEPTVGWFSFACLTIRPCELLGGCFKYVLVYPGKMSKNLAKMSASPTHTTSHFVQRFSIRLREKFGWQLLAAPWWLCSYPPAVFFPDSAVIERHTAHGDGFLFPFHPPHVTSHFSEVPNLWNFRWVVEGEKLPGQWIAPSPWEVEQPAINVAPGGSLTDLAI